MDINALIVARRIVFRLRLSRILRFDCLHPLTGRAGRWTESLQNVWILTKNEIVVFQIVNLLMPGSSCLTSGFCVQPSGKKLKGGLKAPNADSFANARVVSYVNFFFTVK